jgi:hypothetical protein
LTDIGCQSWRAATIIFAFAASLRPSLTQQWPISQINGSTHPTKRTPTKSFSNADIGFNDPNDPTMTESSSSESEWMSDDVDEDYDPGITEWTTLRIPVTCSIEDGKTETGKIWFDTHRCLTEEQFPDLCGAGWGRIDEDPETVWFYISE